MTDLLVYEDNYSSFLLSNGLRVAHLQINSRVEYCGVAVRAGSRDEVPEEFGLAHFVEHTIFKGTDRRPASSIINHMEAVGGELNAYTTKEETYVYSVFPEGNFRRAATLIADLVQNSIFPDNELDKEREVVAEEIDSYLDSPAEAVFDDFDDLIFEGSSLGHNILGNRETLARFDSAMSRGFINRFYTAPNMVFFYLGPQSPAAVARIIEPLFEGLSTTPVIHTYATPAEVSFCIRREDEDTHQAHTVAGATIPSLYSPEISSISLLNNLLGGPGMNSRLNVALRERRGLVYSVDSTTSLYSDTGLLTIYFGCNPEDYNRCLDLTLRELDRLAEKGLTAARFESARKQYLGQLIVASASLEQLALNAARSLLFFNRITTPTSTARRISAITLADINATASRFASSRFSALTLG